VAFPTSTCVIDEKLHVYYGGADKACCLAVVESDDLLQYVLNEG
jgi:beta-1,2-mannobiose phosphorylase / 1,2-beta-oligomannan phosphorylase